MSACFIDPLRKPAKAFPLLFLRQGMLNILLLIVGEVATNSAAIASKMASESLFVDMTIFPSQTIFNRIYFVASKAHVLKLYHRSKFSKWLLQILILSYDSLNTSSYCCARGVGRPSRLFLFLALRYSSRPSSPCEVAQRAIVSRSFWRSIRGTPYPHEVCTR